MQSNLIDIVQKDTVGRHDAGSIAIASLVGMGTTEAGITTTWFEEV